MCVCRGVGGVGGGWVGVCDIHYVQETWFIMVITTLDSYILYYV